MKQLLLTLALIISPALKAETSITDQVFNQYAEQKGFTTINISTSIFSMLAKNDQDAELLKKIDSIKILSVDDPAKTKIDFRKDLINQLPRDQYKELMVIKEKNQEVIMLVKQSGQVITEFLMVVGGEDNALIKIQGLFDTDTLRKLGQTANIGTLAQLQKLKI